MARATSSLIDDGHIHGVDPGCLTDPLVWITQPLGP